MINVMRKHFSFIFLFLFFVVPAVAQETAFERKVLKKNFAEDAQRWKAEQNSRLFLKDDILCVEADGGQPIISCSTDEVGGLFRIILRLRTTFASSCQVLWTTKGSPRRDEENSVSFALKANGQWNDYEFELSVPDILTSIAFRFTSADGVWELRSYEVFRTRSHPLTIKKVVPVLHSEGGVNEERLRYTVANTSPIAVSFRIPTREAPLSLDPGKSIDLLVPIRPEGNLAAVNLWIESENFPSFASPVFLYRPEGRTDWIRVPLGGDDRTLEIAPDARLARIRRGEEVVAILAPLVHRNGTIPTFQRKSVREDAKENAKEDKIFEFDAPDARLRLDVRGESIRFLSTDKLPKPEQDDPERPRLEGPVVRVFGTLTGGLLPGVEFLGPGDESSSTVDIEEPYQDRSQPNPSWLTMPLAVLATEKISCVLTWSDPTLQPTFSTPNLKDRTSDHRMSLIGETIDATLQWSFPPETPPETSKKETVQGAPEYRLNNFRNPHRSHISQTDETAVLRALRDFVRSRGLPEPPPAPRSSADQLKFCLDALRGPLQASDGVSWSVAVDMPLKPFADILSTLARLTGSPPKPLFLVSGGSDIANDAVYFLTGRGEEWKEGREKAIRGLLTTRSPDGSFLYRSRFPEVETASTSFGLTAIRTLEIMEFVRLTGDKELFALVEQSLEYLRYCDIPRGGFYRDTPMHTPDLLTAATLTWLFSWAYEQNDKPEYLEAAKRFAVLGLPFVYQWTDRPIMLYATVPKFGATRRRPPYSFSHADPRTGILYAYAVNILSRHDKSTDWKRLATGILQASEAMQYPDGPDAGCVPEMFVIRNQERRFGKLNPAAIVSLRLAVEGKLDSLAVLSDRTDRFVSPYPIRRTATNGVEAFDVPSGRPFQILRNGIQILEAVGNGPVRID